MLLVNGQIRGFLIFAFVKCAYEMGRMDAKQEIEAGVLSVFSGLKIAQQFLERSRQTHT